MIYSFRANNNIDFFRQKFRLLIYLDRLSHIHMTNIPSHVVEGIRTQAAFVLQTWRRRVVLGFNDHHPWVAVAGLVKLLRYIPKYDCRYPLSSFVKKSSFSTYGLALLL